MGSRIVSVALICVVLCALPCAEELQSTPSLEHQVKIAFLYNFAKFVDWPSGAFQGPSSPLNLGVLGHDDLCREIEQALQGKVVNGRPLVVRRLRPGEAANGLEILFVGPGQSDVRRLVAGLSAAPILTVGDDPNFARQGGIIGFKMDENKVRFEINLDAARRSGLKISSRLLAVALIIHEGDEPEEPR